MAKGGSGDVLAGMILSLVGQGLAPQDAARVGAWLHGRTGDVCANQLSEYGMTPTDMLAMLPEVLARVQYKGVVTAEKISRFWSLLDALYGGGLRPRCAAGRRDRARPFRRAGGGKKCSVKILSDFGESALEYQVDYEYNKEDNDLLNRDRACGHRGRAGGDLRRARRCVYVALCGCGPAV